MYSTMQGWMHTKFGVHVVPCLAQLEHTDLYIYLFYVLCLRSVVIIILNMLGLALLALNTDLEININMLLYCMHYNSI